MGVELEVPEMRLRTKTIGIWDCEPRQLEYEKCTEDILMQLRFGIQGDPWGESAVRRFFIGLMSF